LEFDYLGTARLGMTVGQTQIDRGRPGLEKNCAGKLKSAGRGRIVGADRKRAAAYVYSPKLHGAASNQKEGDRQMEAKPAQQNIQDSFLNTARKERHNITIYLVSGVKLTGRIRSFDKYSVVLETSNQEQLIFKHAISTVVISRGAHTHIDAKAVAAASHAEVAMPNVASGTEG
jgi:host factor-I protein